MCVTMKPKTIPLLLALLLGLALAACGGTGETGGSGAPEEESASELSGGTVTYAAEGGLILTVPAEYDQLVRVTVPEDSQDGTLFTVSELASLQWGEKLHPGEDWGDGWLFGIGQVGEQTLHEMLCYDMSGAIPFATDGDGTYYVFYHPTDVRLVRESYDVDPDSPDFKQWSDLNQWAWTMQETFTMDNGLTYCTLTNTSVDMTLAQVAYMDEPYTLTALDYGALSSDQVDRMTYLEPLMEEVSFQMAESAQQPDGEYISLELPQEGERLDFFLTDGNLVREVYDGEETFYRATYAQSDTEAAQVVRDWYHALAEAEGMG